MNRKQQAAAHLRRNRLKWVESGHCIHYSIAMLLNRTLYAIFVGLLAFSPILSLTLSDDLNWTRFLWVGPALSLPATLAVARLMGREDYCAYWDYLESFPISSKATTIAAWGAITLIAAAISFAAPA